MSDYSEWFLAPLANFGLVFLSALGIYVALLICVRLVGLRSFSKMSSFDFAITVAIGSLVATVLVSKDPPVLQGAMAVASLFIIQFVVSQIRSHTSWMTKIVDNQALLLMVGEEVLEDNLHGAGMNHNDLRYKLRQAGITHPDQVLAVVMETTGDISVLEKHDDGRAFDPDLFEDVRDGKELMSRLGPGEDPGDGTLHTGAL
jgi:uncharacterized membrane protein YcaP (DUF421 family)